MTLHPFWFKRTYKKFYDRFLWMGFNYLKDTEPLRGDTLNFLPLSSQELDS